MNSISVWCELYQQLIKGVFTLITAGGGVFVGAWLGMRAYFRQKEYELVKERYLEGAIDVVASEVEQSLDIFRHNWTRCINILKAFRDEKAAFDPKELSLGFRDFEMSIHRIPHHRIGDLVGSQVIWDVYQLAISFAANKNSVLTKEIPEIIRLKLSQHIAMAEPEVIVNETFEDLWKIDEASHRFAHLTRVLHELSRLLEKERMTFNHVGEFRNRGEVKTLIVNLESEFARDLAGYGDEQSSGQKPNASFEDSLSN